MTCATIRCASVALMAALLACSKHDDASLADADAAPAPSASAAQGSGTVGPGRRPPPGPRSTVTIGPPRTSVPVANAERVLASLRPRFRSCYNEGLTDAPGMAGTLTLSAKLAPNGDVQAADPTRNDGIAEPVAKCCARALRSMQFAAPGPAGATLEATISFAAGDMPDGGWPATVAPALDAGPNTTGTGKDLKGGSGDGIGAPGTGR